MKKFYRGQKSGFDCATLKAHSRRSVMPLSITENQSLLLHPRHTHPNPLPNMTIRVGQVSVVHKAQVLFGIDIGGASVFSGGTAGELPVYLMGLSMA